MGVLDGCLAIPMVEWPKEYLRLFFLPHGRSGLRRGKYWLGGMYKTGDLKALRAKDRGKKGVELCSYLTDDGTRVHGHIDDLRFADQRNTSDENENGGVWTGLGERGH